MSKKSWRKLLSFRQGLQPMLQAWKTSKPDAAYIYDVRLRRHQSTDRRHELNIEVRFRGEWVHLENELVLTELNRVGLPSLVKRSNLWTKKSKESELLINRTKAWESQSSEAQVCKIECPRNCLFEACWAHWPWPRGLAAYHETPMKKPSLSLLASHYPFGFLHPPVMATPGSDNGQHEAVMILPSGANDVSVAHWAWSWMNGPEYENFVSCRAEKIDRDTSANLMWYFFYTKFYYNIIAIIKFNLQIIWLDGKFIMIII